MQLFKENQYLVVLKPLVSLISHPVACNAGITVDRWTDTDIHTHTHTHTHTHKIHIHTQYTHTQTHTNTHTNTHLN